MIQRICVITSSSKRVTRSIQLEDEIDIILWNHSAENVSFDHL